MIQGVSHAMAPAYDEQKTTEAASLLLAKCEGTMRYILLLKLLYLVDRKAWQLWERPLTFDSYYSLPQGPVVSTTYNIIKDEAPGRGEIWRKHIERVGRYRVRLKKMPAIRRLSQAEVDLLNAVYAEHAPRLGWRLVDFTHTLPEYEDPQGSSLPIPLSKLLRVLSFTDDDVSRIRRELRDEAEVDAILGV